MKAPEQEPHLTQLETSAQPEQSFEILGADLLEIEKTRLQKLASIKDRISLKYFHEIEQKLQREQKLAEDLLNIKRRRIEYLSKYSHILDTHYFEQQLIQ